jgi:hypothetical protein
MVDVTGEKNHYIYKVPVLKMDKPGAKKVNEKFLNLEKKIEQGLFYGQLVTTSLEPKVFLNEEIISLVMDIGITGPGGITVVNYDIEKDKELSTKELLDRYQFDPQKLIDVLNILMNLWKSLKKCGRNLKKKKRDLSWRILTK